MGGVKIQPGTASMESSSPGSHSTVNWMGRQQTGQSSMVAWLPWEVSTMVV
jgi:hypothetical protein